MKQVALPCGHLVPLLVLRQRQRSHQAYDVVWRRLLLKIDTDILIQQASLTKRGPPRQPVQLAAALGHQVIPIGQ